MASPKNQRGFRKIHVDGIDYNWNGSGNIDIRLKSNPKGQALKIDYGWYDVWLYVNKEEKPSEIQLKQVTPKIVAEAIRFGRENGWKPENKLKDFLVYYHKNEFKLTKKENL